MPPPVPSLLKRFVYVFIRDVHRGHFDLETCTNPTQSPAKTSNTARNFMAGPHKVQFVNLAAATPDSVLLGHGLSTFPVPATVAPRPDVLRNRRLISATGAFQGGTPEPAQRAQLSPRVLLPSLRLRRESPGPAHAGKLLRTCHIPHFYRVALFRANQVRRARSYPANRSTSISYAANPVNSEPSIRDVCEPRRICKAYLASRHFWLH
jgi:hypothetical protein